jgi:hypothetical protein
VLFLKSETPGLLTSCSIFESVGLGWVAKRICLPEARGADDPDGWRQILTFSWPALNLLDDRHPGDYPPE